MYFQGPKEEFALLIEHTYIAVVVVGGIMYNSHNNNIAKNIIKSIESRLLE